MGSLVPFLGKPSTVAGMEAATSKRGYALSGNGAVGFTPNHRLPSHFSLPPNPCFPSFPPCDPSIYPCFASIYFRRLLDLCQRCLDNGEVLTSSIPAADVVLVPRLPGTAKTDNLYFIAYATNLRAVELCERLR
jgi:hypothetical protein